MSRTELLEWIAILIAIVSLWPLILGVRSLWYYAWLVIVLAAMVKIFLNRVARLRRVVPPSRKETKGDGH